MLLFSNKLNKSILDPIHGLIKMTEEEMQIISHPLFHRLRRIKQNTFLYYVFPSANHTRFEHSIGVMHLASEMFLNSFENANTLLDKQNKYDLENDNKILNQRQIGEEAIEELFYDLRIAALLHDIGHGPMSHLFDTFAPEYRDFINMIKNDPGLSINEEVRHFRDEFANSFNAIKGDKNQIEHEHTSYYFATESVEF